MGRLDREVLKYRKTGSAADKIGERIQERLEKEEEKEEEGEKRNYEKLKRRKKLHEPMTRTLLLELLGTCSQVSMTFST